MICERFQRSPLLSTHRCHSSTVNRAVSYEHASQTMRVAFRIYLIVDPTAHMPYDVGEGITTNVEPALALHQNHPARMFRTASPHCRSGGRCWRAGTLLNQRLAIAARMFPNSVLGRKVGCHVGEPPGQVLRIVNAGICVHDRQLSPKRIGRVRRPSANGRRLRPRHRRSVEGLATVRSLQGEIRDTGRSPL